MSASDKSSQRKMIRRKIVNAYLSSVISISLVLILIGAAVFLVVNARDVSDYFKETLPVSVLMKQEVSEKQAEEYRQKIEALPFVRSARTISKEEGTQELKEMLGEDFLKVFESSPVPISVDVSLQAKYVSTDSLNIVLPLLWASPYVDEVDCQQSLVEALNSNIKKISAILGVIILLLLFISYVLINNTVRLSVFSRRFTIHTMQLVGATRSFICKPFLKGAFWQGVLSAVIANGLISGALLAMRQSFSALFSLFSLRQMLIVGFVVFLCGVLICMLSTSVVVRKLVDSTRDEIYY